MENITDKYWKKLKGIINERSQRERVLLLVTGIVIIWSIMFNGIITPTNNAYTESNEEKLNLEQEYKATTKELALLNEKLQREINPKPNAEMQQLEEILQEHNQNLSRYKEQLIKPEQVPELLDKLLTDFSGLTLLNVETLSPQALVNDKYKNDVENTSLYRHALRLSFVGEYKDLLAYIRKIEKLPFPLWWDELDYTITQFPQAKIIITVYTLSEHKNWIGV